MSMHEITTEPELVEAEVLEHEQHAITRRGLFRAATAMIASSFVYNLPRVDDGFLAPVSDVLGPTVALGKETDAYFTFDVVAVNELGVQVVDVATLGADGKPVPVKNIKVTLRSLADKKKTVEGITDDKGNIILDIAPMALLDEDGSLLQDIYQCNCEIIVDSSTSRTRLRDLSIGFTRIEGASVLVIGAHKLEKDDTCYIERMGFDGWDILYTQNTFVRSQENTGDHQVMIRFKSTENISVSLGASWTKGEGKNKKECSWYSGESMTVYDSDSGYYKVTFEEQFLKLNPPEPKPGDTINKDVWDGDEITLTVMWIAPDGTGYSSACKFFTEEAPIEGSAYTSPLKPFLTKNGTLGSFSLGNANWPCFNNCNISILNFEFPLHISVTAYDIMVTLGHDLQLTDEHGNLSGDLWKRSPKKCMQDTAKRLSDKYAEGLKKFGDKTPFEDKDKRPCRRTFAKKFDLKIITQVALGVQWDKFKGEGRNIKKTFAGKLGIGVGVSAKGSFDWKFMAGPVPCFFSISPGLEIIGAFSFTCTRELSRGESIDVNTLAETADWVPQGSASLNIKLSLKLSLGVGIDGVLAASLSGGAAILMYIGWGDVPPRDGLDKTHFTVGASFSSEIFLQMTCFSISIDVWSHKWDPFYNNWDVAPESFPLPSNAWGDYSNARFLLTQPDGTKRHAIHVIRTESGSYLADGDVFHNLLPVTMAAMEHSYEATAKDADTSLVPSEVDLPTVHRNKIPVLVELEDGTLVTRLVDCEGANTFSYDDEAVYEEEDELAGGAQEDEATEEQQAENAEEQQTENDEEQQAENPEDQSAEEQEADNTEDQGADEPEADDGAENVPSDDEQEEIATDEPTTDESVTDELAADDPVVETQDDVPADESQTDKLVDEVQGDVSASATDVAGLVGLVSRTSDEDGASDTDAEAVVKEEPSVDEQAAEELPTDGEPVPEEDAAPKETEDESLEAQDADPFTGDVYLGFGEPVVPEFDYIPVEGKTTGAVCGPSAINSIAEHDGIKPDVDVVIYKDVFSDPRQRIVDIDGTPYLFRIMTVDYTVTGKVIRRPRVVASAFDMNTRTWGAPTVIEYNSGNKDILRIDIFDYDFDIVVRSNGSQWTRNVYACLVVTGGLRPNGDRTTAVEAFSTPVVSVVLLYKDLSVYHREVNYVTDIYKDGRAHMLAVPHVADGFAVSDASGVLAFSYLHRSAASADDLMSSDKEKVNVSFGIGYCYVRDGQLFVTINKEPVLEEEEKPPVSLDPTVTGIELVAGSGVKNKYDSLVTILCHKDQGYEVYSAIIPPKGSFANLQVRKCIDSSSTLPHIAAWHQHGTFLFTKYRGEDKQTEKSDYYLYAASFDPLATGQGDFEVNPTRVDLNGFRGGNFCVSPTGKYVFYGETFRDEEDEINRIVASKYMDALGGFSEDFPFCELDHSIDGFEVATLGDEENVFLVNEITNADLSLSQLRYVAVPSAMVAEIESFAPIDPFVCAGKPCDFQIDVRNHGNVPIGGFDVTMCDPKKANRVVGTFTVQEIDPKNILNTPQYQRDWLDNVEGSEEFHEDTSSNDENKGWRPSMVTSEGDMIMPGEVLSYRVTFDIPETWPDDETGSHEKRVKLSLDNVWSPGVMFDPQDEMEKYLDDGVDGTLDISPVDAYANLQDPEETVTKNDDPQPEPEPEPKPKPDPLPQTGDLFDGVAAPLGLALGGLASLVGAYSARRVEVEREERDSRKRVDGDEE